MTNFTGWNHGNLLCARIFLANVIFYGFIALAPAVAQESPNIVNSSTAAVPLQADASADEAGPASSRRDVVPPAPQTMGLRAEPLGSISHQLTFDERLRIYRGAVFSPTTVVSPLLGAAIDQWQNEPTEWEQGMAGYARRFGSGLGRNLANKTLVFGVAAFDGEDPRYFPADSASIVSRTRHAVVAAFLSNSENGSRMPAYAHFAGAYGSSFLAMTWYPPSQSTVQHALVQGTTKIAMNAGMNVLREFWPDIKQRLHFGN